MEKKGRVARYMVGPRVGSSRAARHDATRVSRPTPKRHFKPRAAFSHPVQSSSTPRMSIWTPKGLAREPRQTALSTPAEK